MTDTAKARKTESGRPGRRPLVDDELVISWLRLTDSMALVEFVGEGIGGGDDMAVGLCDNGGLDEFGY